MPDIAEFITRWSPSGGSERSNYAVFLTELCDLLGVPRPEPSQSDSDKNNYVIDRDVVFQNPDGSTSTGYADLYKRGCFVLETKQGVERNQTERLASAPAKRKKGHGVRGTKGWDDAMFRARGQAEQYAKALPADHGWPVFLIVADVGHSFDIYSNFARDGKAYLPFPDPQAYRIFLNDLTQEEIRDRLRAVWTDPASLDPSRRAAKVTRELADRLARLAKSLEASGFEPGRTARFLMRCLFTMFAEDVDLIPRDAFTDLLHSLRDDLASVPDMVRSLWESMDKGQFHPVLRKKLRRFNGGLFEDCEALPLTRDQLDLLVEAGRCGWRDVEPAIFGTLLERALDPRERHKLGAHYTPRAYVERLVLPTLVEPLREEWDTVRATAFTELTRGDRKAAANTLRDFHARLCNIRVLDPACGSGNFLYVALEHLKRLEGEILNALRDLRETVLELKTVDPHQFLGIEVNPRAAAIADLVLWIGYLQWHIRTRHIKDISEPIIRKFENIENRDAVLAWDSVEEVRDEQGQPVTRWDGRTTKPHPVTGEEVPDDSARVPVLRYVNPRKAEWPKADYIVGNPPFIGVRKMRLTIGNDYVDALTAAHPEINDTSDYVMYWWDRGATLCESLQSARFGFITTNSIVQSYCRPVVQKHLCCTPGIRLVFAIADHPWVESADGAAVQVSMTVGECSIGSISIPKVGLVHLDEPSEAAVMRVSQVSHIGSTLRSDFDIATVHTLSSNRDFCFQGVIPGNDGFKISRDEESQFSDERDILRKYIIGKDIVQSVQHKKVIDAYGLTESELREKYPRAYQHLLVRVKPERDVNPREIRRRNWWLFAENAPKLRRAISGLKRFIVTPNTAKHRPFVFVSGEVLPDAMAYAIASNQAFVLGVLSSQVHAVWAVNAGGTLEDRPRYNSKTTFTPFPFPVIGEASKSHVEDFAEQLDAHRKRQQAAHPDLTITGMYNVLEKLRSGEALTPKEKIIHEHGLVSVLKQIHDDLDAAVFDAYGWPHDLTDEQILERLVALNAQRAAEEAQGLIRWLRPDFQNPSGTATKQTELSLPSESEEETDEEQPTKKPARKAAAKKSPWPKKLSEQVQAISRELQSARSPRSPADLAKSFSRAKADDIEELLETLASLGKARALDDGRYCSV